VRLGPSTLGDYFAPGSWCPWNSGVTTALDTASVEAEWLRELLMDLPVVEKHVLAISMNCDN
jgi:hypothetical protein